MERNMEMQWKLGNTGCAGVAGHVVSSKTVP